MTDDFEDQLRAAAPAEVPADLMRRLRHAEPVGCAGTRWPRLAQIVAAALATAALVTIVASSLRWRADHTATKRQRVTVETVRSVEGNSFDFGGPIAMNIRMGASPDLMPISFRPSHDPSLFDHLNWPGGTLNLRVETPNLNNTTRN